jgi:Protein of unknown function (DUF3363)
VRSKSTSGQSSILGAHPHNGRQTARSLNSRLGRGSISTVQAQGGPVPGRDYDAYVGAHVRPLEPLRRAGTVERLDADRWRIPDNFEAALLTMMPFRVPRFAFETLRHQEVERNSRLNGDWLSIH